MHNSFIDDGAWIRRFHPSPTARMRLFCFPHAGGSASFYFPLSEELSPAFDVAAVQYPGRQDRHTEPNIPDIGELSSRLAGEIAPWTELPYAFFGHSMGATLAYETALKLREIGREATTLFVSGRRAPHRNIDAGLHLLPDDQLVASIQALEGTGPQTLRNAEVLKLITPALRSDYQAAETYQYISRPVLSCPIHALTGSDDPLVSVDEMRHWQDHTEAAFDLKVFSGGHFYFLTHQSTIARTITESFARSAAR